MVGLQPKFPRYFYRSANGREPVRECLQGLSDGDCRAIGLDLMRAQFRWPVGMPHCRPMGRGLFEIRSTLPGGNIARVLLMQEGVMLVALHGFIKKTRATPQIDLELALRRMKEVQR